MGLSAPARPAGATTSVTNPGTRPSPTHLTETAESLQSSDVKEKVCCMLLGNGVGTNSGVGGRRGEARRAESGEWGSWGGDSQPLPTN